jgi:hypothetical protein
MTEDCPGCTRVFATIKDAPSFHMKPATSIGSIYSTGLGLKRYRCCYKNLVARFVKELCHEAQVIDQFANKIEH